MALALENLDDAARQAMRGEIEDDIEAGRLYLSSRLSAEGALDYPGLLLAAAESTDDDWLAGQLAQPGRMVAFELGRSKTGRQFRKRIPRDAPITLAEGEFNRYYLRGLCRVAQKAGEEELEIYRAKSVRISRPESRRLVGRLISAPDLLKDLRDHPGVDTALGLPPGPNSGLSARRIPE